MLAEYITKPDVFCFQGVWKETSGMKWVKQIISCVSVRIVLTN